MEIDQVLSEYYLDQIEINKQIVDKNTKHLDGWGNFNIDFVYFNKLGVLDYYFEKLYEAFIIKYEFESKNLYNNRNPLSKLLHATNILYHVKLTSGEHKLISNKLNIEHAFIFIDRLKNKRLEYNVGSYKGEIEQIYFN